MASLTMSARCGSAPIVSPRRARHHLRPWRAAVPPLRRGATVLDTAAADADADAERAAVEADTRAWLDTVVMGLNLCPFARAALPGTSVLVTRASTLSELRVELARELAVLRDAPVETARTTLVVIPPSLLSALDAGTFEGFMDGAIAAAEDETRADGRARTREARGAPRQPRRHRPVPPGRHLRRDRRTGGRTRKRRVHMHLP